MDALPSSQFRKTYASLTTTTIVTVNGHPIGVWMPSQPDLVMKSVVERPGKGTEHLVRAIEFAKERPVETNADRLSWTPEFRPAPKPGRK